MRDIIIHLVSLHYQTQITIHLLKEIYLLFLKNMLYFLLIPLLLAPLMTRLLSILTIPITNTTIVLSNTIWNTLKVEVI